MTHIALSIVVLLGIAAIARAQEVPGSSPATQPIGTAVSPTEFASLIGRPDHVLLDVRTPEEYAEGHLAGSVLLDFHDASFAKKIGELSRDKTYLIYCRSGRRSQLACVQMKELGFAHLLDLKGGINAWEAEGRPVEKGSR